MFALKVESQLRSDCARADEMRSAKCRKKVVQRFLLRQVNHRHLRAPPETIAMKQIVVAHRQVKQMTWRNPRRIFIVVLGAFGGNLHPRGTRSRWIGTAA